MRLSFSTLACPAWSLDQILDTARQLQLGVDFRGLGPALDVSTLPEFTANLNTTLARFRQAGVATPCFSTSIKLITPKADEWQKFLDEAQRYAELAGKAGATMLRIFGGNIPKEMTRDDAAVLGRRHLRQLVKVMQPFGVHPVLETHDDWSTSTQVLPLLEGTTPAEVGVLWDIEHPHVRGEPLDVTLTAFAERLQYVHVKDALKDHSMTLLGQGAVPVAEAVRTIRGSGYAGWFCYEGEKRWQPNGPEPEVSIPQFASYLRGL
jgi:sugar phosphate isomerase/epimerase